MKEDGMDTEAETQEDMVRELAGISQDSGHDTTPDGLAEDLEACELELEPATGMSLSGLAYLEVIGPGSVAKEIRAQTSMARRLAKACEKRGLDVRAIDLLDDLASTSLVLKRKGGS